jgi:predicted AAA+ superfamily ATPase
MIHRFLSNSIEKSLFKGQIILIYGARQVGKTTLVKEIISNFSENEIAFFDCDLIRYREAFSKQNEIALQSLVKDKKVVVIDEAQRVENIGLTLKILHTHFPQTQFIATGSSSFELANRISEPLTGRVKIFTLYPLSIQEIKPGLDVLSLRSNLENILVYGFYPSVYGKNKEDSTAHLNSLTGGFLYQDLLQFEDIKKPKIIDQILRLLAYQIGSEVSFSEIATKIGVSTATVIKYIDLLEKSFIVFSLSGFSKNLRNEINKSPKIYFYDLGVRNSLIQNFNTLDFRNDVGALWENFLMVERMKYIEYNNLNANTYFWRNYQRQEIDYIEEAGGVLNTYEFKWNSNKKSKLPNSFKQAYPNHTFKVINQDNWLEFVG